MVRFLIKHISMLKEKNIRLIATGTTGGFVERAGLTVEKMLSGPRGGDAQIASRVAEGKTDMVIFFRDPMDKHPHEPDITMLMRMCDVHNVPLATKDRKSTRLTSSP